LALLFQISQQFANRVLNLILNLEIAHADFSGLLQFIIQPIMIVAYLFYLIYYFLGIYQIRTLNRLSSILIL